MAENNKLESNTNDETNKQAILGKLLQKKRAVQQSAQVEVVLQSSITIEKKINQIEEIDKEAEKITSSYLSRNDFSADSKVKKTEKNIQAKQPRPSFHEYHRTQQSIKQTVKEKSYWKYLFSDSRNIKRFGNRKHIFEMRIFTGKTILTNSLKKYFPNVLQKNYLRMLPGLNQILQHGWLFLKKEEYNVLNLLHALVQNIIKLNFNRLNYKSRFCIDRITQLESKYLSLSAIPDSLQKITYIIDQSNENLKEFQTENKNLKRDVCMLFQEDITIPSFYNFIIGANMVKYRRLLGLQDLIKNDTAPLISTEDWECSEDLYSKIQEHIKGLENELIPLVKYYAETARKIEYVPVDANRNPDQKLLMQTWDNYYGDNDFKKDNDNIIRFSVKLCKLILDQHKHLLIGTVVDKQNKELKIFSEQVFSGEIGRISNSLSKIEVIMEIMPTFSRNRYLKLKQTRKGHIPNEAALMQILAIIISVSIKISEQMINILISRKKGTNPSENGSPLDMIMINRGAFFLPSENKVLNKPHVFSGLTVVEAMHNSIGFLLSIAIHLNDPETTSIIKREVKQKQKITQIIKELKRLATKSEYTRMSDENNLALF